MPMTSLLSPYIYGIDNDMTRDCDYSTPWRLKNLGNTCYLNSALQLFSCCPIFTSRLAAIGDTEGVLPTRLFPSKESRAVDLKKHIVDEVCRVVSIIGNKASVDSAGEAIDSLEISNNIFSPHKLRRLFSRLFTHFKGNRQQDVHEFIIFTLNVIHEMSFAPIPMKLKKACDVVHKESPPGCNVSSSESVYLEESFVSDTFGGVKQYNVRCKECNRESVTHEQFLTGLSLELPSSKIDGDAEANDAGKKVQYRKSDFKEKGEVGSSSWWSWSFFSSYPAGSKSFDNFYASKQNQSNFHPSESPTAPTLTLSSCFRQTFSTEDLSNAGGLYHCSKCNKHVQATRKTSLKFAPQTLILHLKRFTYDGLNKCSKVKTKISFPLYDLDLANILPRTCPDGNQNEEDKGDACKYDLIGLVEHQGTSCRRGHYVSYIRKEKGGKASNTPHHSANYKWYRCDDATVTLVEDIEEVLGCEAYMLFYTKTRRSSPWKQKIEIEKVQRGLSELLEKNDKNRDAYMIKKHRKKLDSGDLYVSRYWVQKCITSITPGPINNWRYLCRHGICYQQCQDKVVPVPHLVYRKLEYLFGAVGPGGLNHHNVWKKCQKCEEEKQAWEVIRNSDREFFEQILVKERADENAVRGNDRWYIIDAKWLSRWKAFLFNDPASSSYSRITRYQWGFNGSTGYPPPPPISNSALLLPDLKTPKLKLKPRIHYRGVSETIFTYLRQRYGGGPTIRRGTLDIYDDPI